MKPVRLLLIGAALLAVLFVAAAFLAFNARVQTWAARRELAAHPQWGATLGSLSAGLARVELKNLRIESHGAVLSLPALEVELPVISAGLKKRVTITRLIAKGWTLDLTKVAKVGEFEPWIRQPARPGRLVTGEFSLLPSALAADPAPVAASLPPQLAAGIFAQLGLPVDLAVEDVTLEGEVILPAGRGHARLTLTGGGLDVGREGKFDLLATAALTSTTVSTVASHAVLTATMDTPRTFTKIGLKADATASGLKFPRGVKLALAATAAVSGNQETYAVEVATAERPIATVQATFDNLFRDHRDHTGPIQMRGSWTMDVRDTDLSPFALGRELPVFAAKSDGKFLLDASALTLQASGRLEGTADKLNVLRPELAAVGNLRFSATCAVSQNGDQTRVEQFVLDLSGAQPVARIATVQPFTYNRVTHGLIAVDPARDLFSVTLQGLPLAWVRPVVTGFTIAGADLRGEFLATASNGGFSLRPKMALTTAGVAVTHADKPWLNALDLSVSPSIDYTPSGWQVSIAPLQLKSGDVTVATLEAKAGQLAGADQPIKAAGKFSALLPALLAQPVAGGAWQLARGELTGDFAANLGATQEFQAKLALANLEADPKVTTEKLPAISADIRADIAAGGQLTINAPLLFERDGRKSDLSLVGTLTSDARGGRTVAARVSSNHLVVDDVKILAAPLAPPPNAPDAAAVSAAKPDAAPPWAGLSGQVALALKEVVYSGTFQATDVAGTLRIDAGAVTFDGMRAGFGQGSDAKISGAVTFDAKAAVPYALNADLAVTDFDPAPLFKALNPGQPATVEGKFNVTSKLSGQATRPAEIAAAAHGEFQLSSKGGVFRGLPVSFSEKNEAVGKIAAGVALVGSALDVFKARKDESEVTSTAKAVAEVSKVLAAIPYDQLNVALTRDASLNLQLKGFTLISPEMRLTGGGTATHQAAAPLLDEPLAMEFKLRARGRTGDLLKYLGKLEPQADELGYAACTLPLKVAGTIGKPDTSELNNALAALALEKTGVTDKASELWNKLFRK